MIKINLVREGRAVRGAGAAPAAAAAAAAGGGKANNLLILGLLVIGVVLAAGYWFIKNRELKEREETVAARQAEADKLEAIIKEVEQFQKRKESLQNRIDLINQLKQNQKGPVRIMDRISQDLPDLVWLDKMNVTGGRITLQGRGLNPNAIANFVENVKKDPYFEEPELGSMTQVSAPPAPAVYQFDMNFAFSYAPKGTAPAGTDTTGAGTSTGTTGTTNTAAPGGGAQS